MVTLQGKEILLLVPEEISKDQCWNTIKSSKKQQRTLREPLSIRRPLFLLIMSLFMYHYEWRSWVLTTKVLATKNAVHLKTTGFCTALTIQSSEANCSS